MKFFLNNETNQKSSAEKLKLEILAKRLKIESSQASGLIKELKLDVSKILQLPVKAINTHIEFSSSDLDMVMTIEKHDTPS